YVVMSRNGARDAAQSLVPSLRERRTSTGLEDRAHFARKMRHLPAPENNLAVRFTRTSGWRLTMTDYLVGRLPKLDVPHGRNGCLPKSLRLRRPNQKRLVQIMDDTGLGRAMESPQVQGKQNRRDY